MPMECRFTRKHYCFWVLIHVAFVGVLESCLEEERLGLLSIKDHFKLYIGDANEFLPSWTDDSVADCCSWERVKCNNATMVTQLSLGHLLPWSMNDGKRVLNMSLFTSFKELLNLNLSQNYFTVCNQNYDFKALKNLVTLDLSYNNFSGNMELCLSTLTSLQSLFLCHSIGCNGNLSIPGLCELRSLQKLFIGDNNLSGTIPPCLGSLTSLRILDLSFNRLKGDISSSPIFNLKDLKYIVLTNNLFDGLFSFYSIANFTNLEGLMLSNLEVQTHYSWNWLPTFQLKALLISNCKFHNIPQFLVHQTELRVVDLSHNNLTGTFPNWLLENNTKLEFLSLRNNSFTGQFRSSSNSRFVTRSIDISDNHLCGELQPDIGYLFAKARALNLSANAFKGHIPFSIGHMQKLIYLDLSNNKFLGEIATTLVGLANFSNLKVLAASNNTLHGRIPDSINMTSLRILQLSENHITGNLSSWISHYPNLQFLDISHNHIAGEIPPSIGNLTSVEGITLNMASNELKGRIPSELARLRLCYLDLSHNFLSGPIPSCFNSSSLQHFNLEGNRLTGSIPETLFNSSAIHILNIGNNLLSGHIPSSVGALLNMRVLLLRQNSLRGLIPNQLCQLNKLDILDLSHNLFSGPIPHCFGNISFGKLTLSNFAYQITGHTIGWGFNPRIGSNQFYSFFLFFRVNVMYGQLVQVGFVTKTMTNIYKGSILDLMTGLDLSCNQLTGKIPAELGNLSCIHALNLSHNQLTGFIPTTFAKLKETESLDLSHNKLSGGIPSELIGLHYLSTFSVAYNNLSGRLPDMDRQFQTFDNKCYEGNPFLCGPPLTWNCNVINDIPKLASSNTDASEEKWYDIDPVFFIASFMASYLVFLVAFALVLYINLGWRRRLFMFIENLIDKSSFLVFYIVPKLFAALYR